MAGGPSRGSDLVGRKFHAGCFFGVFSGFIFLFIFDLFIFAKIKLRLFLRNKADEY